MVVDEVWTLHCTEPSTHVFTFGNAIEVADPHVEDPNPDNNSASTDLSVDVIAEADIKISGQAFVDPPAEINVSQDVDVTLRKTLHNNGPDGPVNVSILAEADAPSGCTATPDTENPTSAILPVSTAVVVDEVWTLHCTQPSTHVFTFSNSIEVTDPHVEDTDLSNNSASAGLSVDVIAQADVKISSQQLISPPTELDVSQDVDVTLRKTLHNNGGYEPVDGGIESGGGGPDGGKVAPAARVPASVSGGGRTMDCWLTFRSASAMTFTSALVSAQLLSGLGSSTCGSLMSMISLRKVKLWRDGS